MASGHGDRRGVRPALICVAMLTGCAPDGAGDADGVAPPVGEISIADDEVHGAVPPTLFGTIEIDTVAGTASNTTRIEGRFVRFGPAADAIGFIRRALRPPADTCEIVRVVLIHNDECDYAPPDDPACAALGRDTSAEARIELVDAGDSLVFGGPTGAWSEAPRRWQAPGASFGTVARSFDHPVDIDGDYLGYSGPPHAPGPVPEGLRASVPGGAFPAFADVPVPRVEPLVNLTPSPSRAEPSDTFRWEGGDDTASVVTLEAVTDDEKGIRLMTCTSADDGEFALPPATLTELGAGVAFSVPPRVRREARRVERGGGAMLVVVHRSEAR